MVSIAYPKAKELLEKRFKFKARRKRDTTEFDGEQAVQEYTETLWCALLLKPTSALTPC